MIDHSRVADAMEAADDLQRQRIQLLADTFEKTLNAYRKSPTTANLQAWKAAERELDDVLDLVEDGAEDAGGGEGRKKPPAAFSSLAKVLRHLQRSGWKIAESTLYKHKKDGLLRPEKTGRYRLEAVEKYAETYLQRIDGGNPAEDKALDRKREADTRKAEAQAKHWELKTKIEAGLYVPREAHETELARRLKVFRSDLLTFNRSKAPRIIELVGGDPEKAPELIEFLNEAVLDALDRYVRNPDPDKLKG